MSPRCADSLSFLSDPFLRNFINRRKKFIIRKIEVIDLSLFKSRIDFLMDRAAVYTDFHLIFLCIFLLSRVI